MRTPHNAHTGFLLFVLLLVVSSCGGGASVTPATTSSAALLSLSITPEDSSIAAGTTQSFTATGIYSDNTTRDLTQYASWDSSDTTNATLLAPGRVRGRSVSRITIRARYGGKEASTTLTITSATIVSLNVTPANTTIAKGTAQQYTATGTFSDNTTQNITQNATWSSSNSSVASISNTSGSMGLATTVNAGTASIQAAFNNVTGATNLTVTAAVLASITVSPSNPSIALGTTRQFTATGTYSDGRTQDLTTAVTWASSNSSVAGISNTSGSQGLATSAATGSATITASSGGISGATTLTVTSATLVSIAVTPSSPSIAAGTTQQFTATGTYTNGSTQNLTSSATWSSSNTARATVSNTSGSKGLATGVSAGTVTMTATSGGISGSATLTVTAATLTSISISPRNNSLSIGGTVQYSATGTYSNGSTQDLTTVVTWSSSATSVATISNAAGSKGLATAVAAGTTTISASSAGISASTVLSVVQGGGTELAWDAPTSNTDGSAITDLAGYYIYFGTGPAQYTQYVNVGNTTSYPISALSALVSSHGTYYISVRAYDSSGNESGYSNEVTAAL